jgi:hypothetical protein
MASRLDDLIREHAERLDQLAGSIDLTDVTRRNDAANLAPVDIEPTWTRSEGRHRWPIVAVAAAAVVAVIVGGLVFAERIHDPTGAVPADQLTTVAPTTTVESRRVTSGIDGSLMSVTFMVPDGWENTDYGGVVKGGSEFGMFFVGADDYFYTSCPSAPVRYPVGPTVDDLVSAWVNLPGVDATAAVDITVDGFDGKQIEFTVPDYEEEDCTGMFYRCGEGQCASLLQNRASPSRHQVGPNTQLKVWVLDVNGDAEGGRLMIMAETFPDTSQQDRAALDEIVASMQFG